MGNDPRSADVWRGVRDTQGVELVAQSAQDDVGVVHDVGRFI